MRPDDDRDRLDRYRAALDEHEASVDAARDQLDRATNWRYGESAPERDPRRAK